MKCAVGSYTGNGLDDRAIAGIGFQPDLVIIKNRVTNFGVFRTSVMSGDSTAYFSNPAANIANAIQSLDADGFTVGTSSSVNSDTFVYDWQAFKDDGAGDFKVGSYVGNGGDDRNITGLGFQPDIVCIKVDNVAQEAYFRTSSNSGDQSMRFTANGDGVDSIQAFLADGFQVGTFQNANGLTYHWFAFKAVAGFIAVGSYNGDTTDNRNITGIGFQPDLVWVKSAGMARCAVHPSTLAGDSTQFYTANSVAADWIQALQADGFQVGTQLDANGVAHRYVAWKVGSTGPEYKTSSDSGVGSEASALDAISVKTGTDTGHATEVGARNLTKASTDSGVASEAAARGGLSYQCIVGSYVGDGLDNHAITGVGFKPDLVLVRDRTTAKTTFFTTSAMSVGRIVGLAPGAGGVPDTGIKTLDADGFTLGTYVGVNGAGDTYDWVAFRDNSSGKLAVGTYTGDGLDGRDITGLGFQPDFVLVKAWPAAAGRWRTSSNVGDQSMSMNAAVDVADGIQAFLSDGFQVGTEQNVAARTYYWFAFKAEASCIKVGTYTGDGLDDRSITGVGFQPDLVWVKVASAAKASAARPSSIATDLTEFLDATAAAADNIQALEADGFQVGVAENANGILYRYAAWKIGTFAISDDSAAETETEALLYAAVSDDLGAEASDEVVLEIVVLTEADSGAGTEGTETQAGTLSSTEAGTGAEAAALAVTGIASTDSAAATEVAARIEVLSSHIIRCTIESTLAALADSLSLVLVETDSSGAVIPFAQRWLTLTEGDFVRVRLGLKSVGLDDYGVFRVDQTQLGSAATSWQTTIQGRDKASRLIEEKGRTAGGFSFGSFPDVDQEEFTRPTSQAIGKRLAEEAGLGLIWDASDYLLKTFAIGKDESMSSALSRLLAPLQQSSRYRTDAWVDGDNLVVRRRGNSPVLGTVDCDLGIVTGISRRRQPLVGDILVYGGTETYKSSYIWNDQSQETEDRKGEKTSQVDIEDDGKGHRVVKTFLLEADGLTWVQVQEEIEDQDFEEVFDGAKWIGRILTETRTTIKTNMNTTEKQEKRTVTLGYDSAYRLVTRHELTEEYNATTFEFDKTGQSLTRFEQITPTDLRTTVTEWKVVSGELKVSKGFPKRVEAPGQLQSSLRVTSDAKSAWDEKEDGTQPTKTKTTETTVQYHGTADGGGTLPRAITNGNIMSSTDCQQIADDIAAESGKWLYAIELKWPRPFAYHKGDRVTLTNLPGNMTAAIVLITSVRTTYDKQAAEWTHDVSFELWADE